MQKQQIDKSVDFFQAEAHRIISLLKEDFLLPSGTFTMAKIEKEKYPYHIFPDLGDFLPFFLYFGEETFIDKQISVFQNTLINDVLISEHKTFYFRNLAKSYEYSDLLYGLIDYYLYKKDESSHKLLIDNVNKAVEIFKFGKKGWSSYYSQKYRFNLPIRDSRDGMMIELFIDLYKISKEEKYLTIAKKIYNAFIVGYFYKRYKVFPTFSSRGLVGFLMNIWHKNYFNSAQIMKGNTNTLFAFLSLYKETGDKNILLDIYQIVDVIKKNATVDNGGVVEIFQPQKKTRVAGLTPSFAMLDFLCDLYHICGDKDIINFAVNIADFWLSKQGRTGLFPLKSNGNESCLDSETDMSIALYKLFELTRDIRYKEAADHCFDGIIKYHGINNYILGVDINTGGIMDKKQRTKYISLFLKLLILKIELSKGSEIYSDDELFNLLRDR